MAKSRDIRFDILKALAISLVVFWHVIASEKISAYEHGRIAAFIVGLNMPLFFAISGYFAANAIQQTGKTISRCAKYLKSMLAYSTLLAIALYALGAYDTLFLMAKRIASIPLFGWWYMWSLMFSMVLAWAIQSLRRHLPQGRWITLATFLTVYIALLALPDSWWQVKYFKYCFPFFALGLAAKSVTTHSSTTLNLPPHPKKQQPTTLRLRLSTSTLSAFFLWLLSAALYATYVIFYNSFPCGFYWTSFNLTSILSSPASFGAYIVRYLVAIAGIILIALPILLLRPNRLTLALSELGTTTMGVYFLHQLILQHFIVPHYAAGGGQLSLPMLLALSLSLWLGCHVFVHYVNAHSFLKKILN